GAGCQRAVDDQEELAGGACGLWVAELAEFVLEELLDALAVLTGDGVRGMAGIGEGQVGGQIAAAAEGRLIDDRGELGEDGEEAAARVLARGLHDLAVPGLVLGGAAAQYLGDQPVLAAKVLIQRAPGHVGGAQQGIDAHAYAVAVGQLLRRLYQALSRPRRPLSRSCRPPSRSWRPLSRSWRPLSRSWRPLSRSWRPLLWPWRPLLWPRRRARAHDDQPAIG